MSWQRHQPPVSDILGEFGLSVSPPSFGIALRDQVIRFAAFECDAVPLRLFRKATRSEVKTSHPRMEPVRHFLAPARLIAFGMK